MLFTTIPLWLDLILLYTFNKLIQLMVNVEINLLPVIINVFLYNFMGILLQDTLILAVFLGL
jgi:hypothetical protein